MKEIDELVQMIKKQLFPYRHERDIGMDSARWGVEDSEFITEWIKKMLKSCARRMRCESKGKCAHYEYSDQARKNYEICKMVVLMMENGLLRISGHDNTG